MNYRYTDKEIKSVLDNLVILVDTREQRNEHIVDFFRKKNINHKVKKLDLGDYSCMIPKGSFEGQTRDIYFDKEIVIERKASIDELAGNFKDDGVRIKTELAHLNKYNIKCFLFIEDPEYDFNIRNGNYRSQYNPKALYNRIKKSIEIRYNTLVRPISKDVIGSEIYNTLESHVYEVFKAKGYFEESDDVATMVAKDILHESEEN